MTRVGGAYFYGVSHAPIPRGGACSVPRFFETSCMRAHSMKNSDQILHGDRTRCEENFYIVDHAPAFAIILVRQTLTRDLCAVANLLVLARCATFDLIVLAYC